MFKKVFLHTILYAIGPQIPRIIGVFLLPTLTQFLTSADYGIYGVILAYTSALNGIRDLGFQQTIVNSFYKAKTNKKRWILAWRQQMGILFLWGIGYSLILGFLMFFTIEKYIHEKTLLLIFIYVIPVLFFDVITMFGFRYYQLSQKPLIIAINSSIAGTVSLLINYYTIVYLDFHFWGFIVAISIGSILNGLLYFYPIFIKHKILPLFYFKKKQLYNYFKVSLPTIPHNLSSYLLNASDRVILDNYKVNINSLGQYNFAYTIGNFADFIGNAIGMAVSPFYLKEYAKRNETGYFNARIITFILQTIFIAFTFLCCLWLKEVFNILSANKQLALSYPLGIIILISFVYRPMYWACVNRLGFEGETNLLWKISFVGGILNIILNIIFVPFWGVYASAIATFIGLLYIGFAGFFLTVFKKINTQNYFPFFWIITIITFAILAYVLKDISWVYKLILTLFTIMIMAILHVKNYAKIKALAF